MRPSTNDVEKYVFLIRRQVGPVPETADIGQVISFTLCDPSVASSPLNEDQ
jgi:hypothetical protein